MKKPPRKGHPIPSETTLDLANLTHPAVREIEVGRGYGITIVPVVTFGNVGKSTMLHVVHEGKALCGTRGEVSAKYEEVQPHAVRIAGANVCYRCRVSLGRVPMPRLKGEE